MIEADTLARLRQAICRDRLIDTAVKLIEVPSPTRSATAVANRLEAIVRADGFEVQRVVADWPESPAVCARLTSPRAGRTLQIDGHLDTVHLDFVPPRIERGILYGSGASDMKGGLAAGVEAMRALRDVGLPAGSVLLTAHDLHESPWGDGSQLDSLIAQGFVGDAVLLPEYVSDCLPVIGRGLAILAVRVEREGVPMHEVMGGIDQPNVIRIGAEIVRRLGQLDDELRCIHHEIAGRESIFVGQITAGEIYNQSPTQFVLNGTRRWLPTTASQFAESQYRQVLTEIEQESGVTIQGEFRVVRGAFELDPTDPIVESFQSAHRAVTGTALPTGPKPFVDDGNSFACSVGIPAITHGPRAKGAHTLCEEVPVDELERVALVYALTAWDYCHDTTLAH